MAGHWERCVDQGPASRGRPSTANQRNGGSFREAQSADSIAVGPFPNRAENLPDRDSAYGVRAGDDASVAAAAAGGGPTGTKPGDVTQSISTAAMWTGV